MRYRFSILLGLLLPAAATAQVSAPRTAGGCVLANDQGGQITVNGVLRRVMFKDPAGKPERVFVVHLPRPTCVEDGGAGQIDGKERVIDVQVMTADEARLAKKVGRHVTIAGTAMPRNTGHHYTPLLVIDPIKLDGQ